MKLDQVQGPRKVDIKTPVKGQGAGAPSSRPVSPTGDHSQCNTPTPNQMRRGGPPNKKKKMDEVSAEIQPFPHLLVINNSFLV